MAIQLLDCGAPSPIERLVDDYLANCSARGLSLRSVDRAYGYSLHAVFLPWCRAEGITHISQLDRRAVDRLSSSLMNRKKLNGEPLSKYSVHTYLRPVRQMLTWAGSVGEEVSAKPQLPRRSKPVRDVLTREEIDSMERIMLSEHDKVIIRVFADCGLRLDELTKLRASDIVRSGRVAFLRVLGKRSRVRDVPVMPQLLRRLERLAERGQGAHSSGRLFFSLRRGATGDYEPLTESGIYKVVTDAADMARIQKRVYPHLLRHSWMTEMLRNGMNPIQLSVIAGASPEVIAACYTHLTKNDAYTAMLRVLTVSAS